MPHASCLVSQGFVAACSAAPFVQVLLVVQLNAVSACLPFWAFAASFIQFSFCNVCWDSVPRIMVYIPLLSIGWLHAGIACLCYCMLG